MPPIAKLAKNAQRQLLDEINYLNTREIKTFCRRHGIPYKIMIETAGGRHALAGEDDRKGVILERIRHFLRTGVVLGATRFPASVIARGPAPTHPIATDRLLYGHYDKTSDAMITLLQGLTNDRFRNGAVARILAREFWARGEAPTFKEFASAWLRAERQHTKPNPEWAFLSDRASGNADPNWKRKRAAIARRVLAVLDDIEPGRARR